MVTVVCTSCGRMDLLDTTLRSFFQFNTFPIKEFILIDDSGDPDIRAHIKKSYYPKKIKFLFNEKRVGQIASIDRAYKQVKTPFIFHLEDDWQFYRGGFIEQSLIVLNSDPKILQVWIRDPGDTNGHPHVDSNTGKGFRIMSPGYLGKYHGFSFNPGLRRLDDYLLIAPFAIHAPDGLKFPAMAEIKIGMLYHRFGFRAALLRDGYVRHIGAGRHVK